ncbi:MAG: 4Fe-4S dicluster domain-containing protein [Dehalococcoidia bacterium]|nr:4Fe-4S dicluster domain-containing protein [Dehalococcoidia bacterium]
MVQKAILFDAARCTACRACQVACKNWNEREIETTTNRGTFQNPPDLSTKTVLVMEFREVGDNGTLRWLYTRRACMHCGDAACIKVCPTGALYRHPSGFVAVDAGKCSGCGYCQEFCPFHLPRIDANRASGMGRVAKCTACTDPGLNRIDNQDVPACVKTCPTVALAYGDRNDLVAAGKARVAELKSQGFSKAYLYGENEVGGTGTLYVLDDSPSIYGLVEDPKVPATAIAWQDVIKPLGYTAVGLVGLGLLLNVLVARARIVQDKEGT